jgi:hypothetical protein
MHFLADAVPVTVSPASVEQAIFLFEVLTVIGFLMGFVIGALKIVEFFRRKPTIDAEFATKTELTTAIAQLRQEASDGAAQFRLELSEATARMTQGQSVLFTKIDDLAKSVNNSFNGVFRDLGKLEGQLATKT